jgi:hypothetical protein
MNTDTMGVYGNYYLKRAIVAQVGLGANLPEDAIYPLNLGDESGKPLDGANKYTISFEKGVTPPVNAFWSITLYDSDGFQVANSLNRFAVSSWMPFKYNSDGSLDLYFQNESPGKDKEANWLPAPKGPFNLTMRLYGPKSDALTGKWNPPPVMRAQSLPGWAVSKYNCQGAMLGQRHNVAAPAPLRFATFRISFSRRLTVSTTAIGAPR